MYFSRFPTFLAQIGDSQQAVEDFFVRVAVGRDYAKLSALLLDYTVSDGERIEDVAYKFYNNMEYFWVVLLINNITDPRGEWPLRDVDVTTLCFTKYGSTTNTHHYETVSGAYVISAYQSLIDSAAIVPITNFDYETKLNDAKRQIKVLDPAYLNEFVNDFSQRVK